MPPKVFDCPLRGVSATAWINAILHLVGFYWIVLQFFKPFAMLVCGTERSGVWFPQFGHTLFLPKLEQFFKGDFVRFNVPRGFVVFGKHYHPGFPCWSIADMDIDGISLFIPSRRFTNGVRVATVPRQTDNRSVSVRVFQNFHSILALRRMKWYNEFAYSISLHPDLWLAPIPWLFAATGGSLFLPTANWN